eukprot:gene63-4312_t
MNHKTIEVGDVQLELCCSLHFFKIPTPGVIKLEKEYVVFTGTHYDNTQLQKKINFKEIQKISKEKFFMKQYLSIVDLKSQYLFFNFKPEDEEIFLNFLEKKTTTNFEKLNKIKELGIETLNDLKKQGEIVDNCNNTLNEIDHNLSLSERFVSQLSSVTGAALNIFRAPPVFQESETTTNKKTNIKNSGKGNQKMEDITRLLDDIKDISLTMGLKERQIE